MQGSSNHLWASLPFFCSVFFSSIFHCLRWAIEREAWNKTTMVWEALLERQVRAYGKVAALCTTILPYVRTAENYSAPWPRVWSTPKLNAPENKNTIGKQWSIASVLAGGGGEIFRDHLQVAECLMMKNTLSEFHFNNIRRDNAAQ